MAPTSFLLVFGVFSPEDDAHTCTLLPHMHWISLFQCSSNNNDDNNKSHQCCSHHGRLQTAIPMDLYVRSLAHVHQHDGCCLD